MPYSVIIHIPCFLINCAHLGSFRLLHSLRGQHDGVLIGINTMLIDNPQLNVRHPLPSEHSILEKKPRAIVFDSKLKISEHIQHLRVHRPIICTCLDSDSVTYATVEAKLALLGGHILSCQPNVLGSVDMVDCFKKLHHRFQMRSILVEGGAHILQDCLENNLAHQALVSIQPCFLGGYRSMISELKHPVSLRDVCVGSIEGNVLVYGRITRRTTGREIEDCFDRNHLHVISE